ncbi:adenylate/guanylate cyclase domain-containing protein [Amycolatopsis antarctica]|uniref:Adenylate/guanylate cyclase domain-containing protein n=1 Tax=Amycolatopsis antarctica TaxID=1854586 RepID=A0A263DAU5_9PSEU|nr:adenylate/guanylate cyclase domain-containing protein [Amycolatopsis antarctica]
MRGEADDRAGWGSRLSRALREADRQDGLVRTARFVRRLAPGDSSLGDPLSTASGLPSDRLAKALAEGGTRRPSVLRELGLTAVQVWQSFGDARGRSRGEVEVTIVFTDLVDFSAWALRVGDEEALRALRAVAAVSENAITRNGGRVVKRLGDGMMAAFAEPGAATRAALQACQGVGELDVDGYRPLLRAGVHAGRPRQVGADYLGVDVNVAARVADAAKGSQVLVSETCVGQLDTGEYRLRRKRRFAAKGAPRDLAVYSVRPG